MKNQSKIILISFFGLIVSAGLFLFVIQPTVDKVSDLKNEVSSKKTDLNQLEEQIVIYKNSQRDLSQASGKDIIAQSLLPRDNLQVAIEEIETAAAKTGVTESLTIPDDALQATSGAKPVVSGKSFLDEVQYNIQTTSNFLQLLNFIQYLEHLPHFTEFAGFSFQSATGTANSSGVFIHNDTILGSIDAVFFVQKQ